MNEEFHLDKWVYTEEDFDTINWHDVHVYALAFNHSRFEFMLDIDYILEWVDLRPKEDAYGFWVAPATLIFENVYGIELGLTIDGSLTMLDAEHYREYSQLTSLDYGGVTIQNIQRSNPHPPKNAQFLGPEVQEWLWEINLVEGEIGLNGIGFKQYLRQRPIFQRAQRLRAGGQRIYIL